MTTFKLDDSSGTIVIEVVEGSNIPTPGRLFTPARVVRTIDAQSVDDALVVIRELLIGGQVG